MRAQTFTCDVESCRKVKQQNNHWFLIDQSKSEITVCLWSDNMAKDERYEHICGESCLQKRISQWAETRVGS